MKPREVTEQDVAFWKGQKAIIQAPPGQEEEVEAIQGVITSEGKILTPWVLDERDFQDSALGPFTVWLSSWGGMPPTDLIILKNGVGEATVDLTKELE